MKHEFGLDDLDLNKALIACVSESFVEDRRQHLIKCCVAAIQYGLVSEGLEFSTLSESGGAGSCVVVVMPKAMWSFITKMMEQREKGLPDGWGQRG